MEGSAAGAAPPGTRGEGGTPSVTPVIDVSDGYWTPKAKAKQQPSTYNTIPKAANISQLNIGITLWTQVVAPGRPGRLLIISKCLMAAGPCDECIGPAAAAPRAPAVPPLCDNSKRCGRATWDRPGTDSPLKLAKQCWVCQPILS